MWLKLPLTSPITSDNFGSVFKVLSRHNVSITKSEFELNYSLDFEYSSHRSCDDRFTRIVKLLSSNSELEIFSRAVIVVLRVVI